MIDFQTINENYETYRRAVAEANRLNKLSVFAALAAASITLVTVTFDGEGDSGQIQDVISQAGDATVELPTDQVEIQRTSWNTGKLDSAQMTLPDAIEELCFDYLSQEHEGWENNDGASGEFTFHVEDSRIELDINQFYMDSTSFSHTF